MKKTLLLILLILLTACSKSEKVFDKLPADAVILAFGDSLTYGTNVNEEQSYPSVLEQLSSHSVINSGAVGELSADGLKRLPAVLDEEHPQLLVLIHGGNDILRRIPHEQIAANLTAMIAEAKKRNIKVVMLGVPALQLFSAVGLFSLESDPLYQQVAEAEKVPIDLKSLPEIISRRELKSDQVHPNAQGYQRLADAVFTLLKNTGAL
ncbi:MAG: GDSL-type esterase/lipase family protein [Methylococcales bacterium]